MKNFNKLQQNIIREEFARAVMIQNAKKRLNEHQFNFFMSELRNYENNLVLTESNQNEMKYSGLTEQLALNESAMERLKNLGRGLLDKIAPDNQKKLEQLASELDMLMKGELKVGEKLGDLAGNEALKVKAAGLVDQIRAISPEAANAAAEAYGIGAKGSSTKSDVPDAADMAKDPKAKAAADKVEDQADAAADKLENPKAKGIFSSIVDSYKYAFAANAKMWKNVFGFFTKAERSPPPRQDDMMMQLLMMLLKQMQNNEMKGEPVNPPTPETIKPVEPGPDVDPPEEVEPEDEKKVITVRSVQRPIINVVQRVAAAQGVDVSVKQAQDIAIAITNNLADQMRANGVVFKGDKPKPEEEEAEVVSESKNVWGNKDVRRLFLEHLSYIISEERLAAKYGMKKEKFSAKEIGLDKRYKFGAVEPRDYIKTLKAVQRRFEEMGYKQKQTHYELKDTDNADNFVDYYDMYLDLQDLRKFNRGTKRVAKDGEESDAIDGAKAKIDYMIKKFELHGDFRDKGTGKEMKKKYIQMKKKMKGMGGAEKIDTKDLSMASAEKGKVNISKTVAKAIQAGGLSPDVAKKITPILKKKVQGIIAKHMGADVRYLEEKINRYVKAVIKEVK
tara:strand:+ start:4037 stop:5890 length:1854 start_codon:yes stop_codon:yes gene_type:complete